MRVRKTTPDDSDCCARIHISGAAADDLFAKNSHDGRSSPLEAEDCIRTGRSRSPAGNSRSGTTGQIAFYADHSMFRPGAPQYFADFAAPRAAGCEGVPVFAMTIVPLAGSPPQGLRR